MERNTTNLLKFFCCILILLHHYFNGEVWVSTFGRISCSVFFFFSAYGITKSLTKKQTSFIEFFCRRISKLYIPLLLVNFICVLGGALGGYGVPIFEISGKLTFLHDIDTLQVAKHVIGLSKIDGVTWFLDVLVIAYILLYIITRNNVRTFRTFLFIGSCGFLVLTDLILKTNICNWPTDSVGIALGYLCAEYEENYSKLTCILKSKKTFILSVCLLLLFSCSYMILLNAIRWRYLEILMVIYSVFAVLVSYSLGCKLKIGHTVLNSKLGTLSYFVYLLHMKACCIVTYALGNKNLFSTIILTFILSIIFMNMTGWINKKIKLQ